MVTLVKMQKTDFNSYLPYLDMIELHLFIEAMSKLRDKRTANYDLRHFSPDTRRIFETRLKSVDFKSDALKSLVDIEIKLINNGYYRLKIITKVSQVALVRVLLITFGKTKHQYKDLRGSRRPSDRYQYVVDFDCKYKEIYGHGILNIALIIYTLIEILKHVK